MYDIFKDRNSQCLIVIFLPIFQCYPTCLGTVAHNILSFLFKVYKVLLPIIRCETLDVEEDLYSVSSTANFNQLIAVDVTEKGYESWYQMCFSSTSLLLHAIIVKVSRFFFRN